MKYNAERGKIMVKLIPKNHSGAVWYTKKENIFRRGFIEAFSKDGFRTLVDIDNYEVIV